jgi:ankyrin repeat protein
MQDGSTPALIASGHGHTETVALLLANIADINAATRYKSKVFVLLS